MVKAIFFDMAGVLIDDPTRILVQRFSRLLHVRGVVLSRAFADPAWYRVSEGQISETEYCQRICRKLRCSFPPRSLLTSIFRGQFTRLNEKALKIAKKLKRQDYIVGIISNMTPLQAKDYKRIFADYYPLFNTVILSYRVGVVKPKLEIFRIARHKAGVKFSEMLFLDDHKENVDTARKLGIKAFVYKNPTQLVIQLRRFGVKI